MLQYVMHDNKEKKLITLRNSNTKKNSKGKTVNVNRGMAGAVALYQSRLMGTGTTLLHALTARWDLVT